MSTIIIPTREPWAVLEALGLTGNGGTGFLLIHPDTTEELIAELNGDSATPTA